MAGIYWSWLFLYHPPPPPPPTTHIHACVQINMVHKNINLYILTGLFKYTWSVYWFVGFFSPWYWGLTYKWVYTVHLLWCFGGLCTLLLTSSRLMALRARSSARVSSLASFNTFLLPFNKAATSTSRGVKGCKTKIFHLISITYVLSIWLQGCCFFKCSTRKWIRYFFFGGGGGGGHILTF